MSTNSQLSEFEQQNVVDVYREIAPHFSLTRFKSWPAITEFIQQLASGSSLLDAGCGNGKNMAIRDDIEWAGCDICEELLDICRSKGFKNVFQADLRNIPAENDSYDNTITVAVVHHIATFEGRVKACQELVRVTKPGGKIFIQVWQDLGVRNKKFQPIDPDKDNGDYFVTWTMRDNPDRVLKRYYHMFKEPEIDQLVGSLDGVTLVEKKVEAKNWVVILEKDRQGATSS